MRSRLRAVTPVALSIAVIATSEESIKVLPGSAHGGAQKRCRVLGKISLGKILLEPGGARSASVVGRLACESFRVSSQTMLKIMDSSPLQAALGL